MSKKKEDTWCYCSECLSPNIQDTFGLPYCAECNSTNIVESDFDEWDAKYKEKYNIEYYNKNRRNGSKYFT